MDNTVRFHESTQALFFVMVMLRLFMREKYEANLRAHQTWPPHTFVNIYYPRD